MPKKVEKPTDASVTMTFEAPRDLFDKIKAVAEEDRRSKSFVIRELLLRALAANEKTA